MTLVQNLTNFYIIFIEKPEKNQSNLLKTRTKLSAYSFRIHQKPVWFQMTCFILNTWMLNESNEEKKPQTDVTAYRFLNDLLSIITWTIKPHTAMFNHHFPLHQKLQFYYLLGVACFFFGLWKKKLKIDQCQIGEEDVLMEES